MGGSPAGTRVQGFSLLEHLLPGAPLPPVTPALRHRAVIPPEELLMLQNTPEKNKIK